jgi:hypothetical protein
VSTAFGGIEAFSRQVFASRFCECFPPAPNFEQLPQVQFTKSDRAFLIIIDIFQLHLERKLSRSLVMNIRTSAIPSSTLKFQLTSQRCLNSGDGDNAVSQVLWLLNEIM